MRYRQCLSGMLVLFTASWPLLGMVRPPCSAAQPAAKVTMPARASPSLWALFRPYLPRLRPPEIVEMVWALATGADLDAGQGWFHPGQSRYSWSWLAARYDTDHNGTITRQEFKGPPEFFERLDRNHDGVLTAEDFDWSDQSPLTRAARQVRPWFRLVDRNSNGRISRQEWEAFFNAVSKGKGYFTPEDLQEAMQLRQAKPPAGKPSEEGPSTLALITGFLTGELGSFHEGPRLGDLAPDFTLKTQDGKQTIRLSQFRNQKPVVLIFGSFT